MLNRSTETNEMLNKNFDTRHGHLSRQGGSSLVELLVGIAVGLMVVMAAIGTLVMARSTSRGVNDQLELQQQANMAIRIMSTMLRQTNTREIEAQPLNAGVLFSAMPVYGASLLWVQGLARDAQDNDDFGIAFSDAGAPLTPDCLGDFNSAPTPAGAPVSNRFFVNNNGNTTRLMCRGTNVNAVAQPLISDVRRLRVLYGVQTGVGVAAVTRYFTQATVPNWATANVVSLEICLEMASAPRGVNTPGNYTDCDGVAQTNADGRVHAVARQVVRLRAVPI